MSLNSFFQAGSIFIVPLRLMCDYSAVAASGECGFLVTDGAARSSERPGELSALPVSSGVDWPAERMERFVTGPEDEFDPECNGDPDSLNGEEDDSGVGGFAGELDDESEEEDGDEDDEEVAD